MIVDTLHNTKKELREVKSMVREANHGCMVCYGEKPQFIIPCGHHFCLECLWDLHTKDATRGIEPKCPKCKIPYDFNMYNVEFPRRIFFN